MCSSKPAEPIEEEQKYSGYLGDLSPEMDRVFLQFKEWVQLAEMGDLAKMNYDDHDLLRFCRARKFVLADIQLMWRNFIEWRQKENVDTIVDTFTFDERWEIQKYYPHCYHKTDK